jgi:gamma-glutamyl:cysteine ligase YbdK (ATP-grasp superfamily)
MGQEIEYTHFRHADYLRFQRRLADETAWLRKAEAEGALGEGELVIGLELEAWLLDEEVRPAPVNQTLLAKLGDPSVVPELARFNIEFNVAPQPLRGRGLAHLEQELRERWAACRQVAHGMGGDLVSIGILPTLHDADLTLANMSPMQRYRALNEQVLRMRRGEPLRLCIEGRESLVSEHRDVMLEAATTSLQAHLQVPASQAVRYYNAAILLSAPMVALSANAPFLFGHQLWDETRIPLFEQSVDAGPEAPKRVSFGTGYARESLLEVFEENLRDHAVLLPIDFGADTTDLPHLRLHNGTIWRWNRPLIGFDGTGRAHLRIEHRVMASGPSFIDMMANLAVFFGASRALASHAEAPEAWLSFEHAQENVYAAARHGLEAELIWLDGQRGTATELLANEILPLARAGLADAGVDDELIEHYLSVAEARVRTGQTGAAWQQRFVEAHGREMTTLTRAYLTRQRTDQPVHTWGV